MQNNKMDVIERHRLHVEASVERDKYAREAIDLLAQRKDKAGMAAPKNAERWDAIEAKPQSPP